MSGALFFFYPFGFNQGTTDHSLILLVLLLLVFLLRLLFR